ncbi:MAG: FGGY family carbohydrate kinase [Thermoguttaceae bacterium]|nr:FGGY family carbohydrate kinase [Thermoguttaceae bacterium]
MYLGLDLGTTNIKARVVDAAGHIAAEGAAPVDRVATPDGGVEQDLEAIWHAVCEAIRQALAAVDPAGIQAVGVSSQGAAMQWLDADDRPVGPVISWLDGRGRPFDRRLTDELGEEFFVRHLGRTPCTMTPGQVLRMRSSPEIVARAARLGWVGDAIVGRLAGRRAHDATSLSIAMLYNPWLDRADPDVLARLGLREDQLPDLVPATTIAGRLTPWASRQTGLMAGIPVSPAIHDQYAGTLGAGAVREGDVYLGTGTAWVLLVNLGRLADPVARGTFVCRHPVEGLFGQMLPMTNGGAALDWVLRITGRPGLAPHEVDDVMADVPPGSDGLCFWPLLSASAEAGQDLAGGGRIAGITLAHTPNHLVRAVVEGLACELARHLKLFEDAGLSVHRLVLCGGAAASRITPQILADVTGQPVACVTQPAVSALGAALIARALVERVPSDGRPETPRPGTVPCPTAGPGADLASFVDRLAPPCRTLSPGPDAACYARLLRRYLELWSSD